MSTTNGMDNPAFTSEEECSTEVKLNDDQQRLPLDQDGKTDGGLVENGHQRTQQHAENERTSPDSHYKTETRIELPETTEKPVAEPKMNGVHGNGNNNDASFLNNSVTSVQVNDTGKKEQIEAVNLELVSMRPYAGNNVQTKGQEACEVPADPYEEYFVPVNEHRKYIRGPEAEVETTVAGVRFDLGPGVGREGLSLRDPAAGLVDYSHWLTALRGEKLYVTKDKRSKSSYWRRMACWGCGLLVLLVAVIIAILAATGVILTQEASTPLENLHQTNSRQFGDVRTEGSQEYVKDPPSSPSPATSTFPPWPTTDETLYDMVPSALDGVLKLDEFRWNDDLNDSKSRVYRQVSAEIEDHLKNMLQKPTDKDMVIKVYDINRDGEVKFRISYPPSSIPEEMQQTFERKLQKNGNMIGQYHLNSLKVHKLRDRCLSGEFKCSEGCNYDYSRSLFVCTCGIGKILDKDGHGCIEENDLSNVEMDDEVPESKTESVRDYVQGRSRGPVNVFEPRRPDEMDQSNLSTEATPRGYGAQDNEHEFHVQSHAVYDASSQPGTADGIHENSDSEDTAQDHSGHDHSMHDHSGHDHSMHDHSGHDHTMEDHSEQDHSLHDHSEHDHIIEDHSGHDHLMDDHSGHDRTNEDNSGHDHLMDDHSGHDHTMEDHSGHDHSMDDHSGHDHTMEDHSGQDHSMHDHSEHDRTTDDHSERDHSIQDHIGHNHFDYFTTQPKSEPTPTPEPESFSEPQVTTEHVPTAEPEPTSQPEPSSNPEPSAEPESSTDHVPSVKFESSAKPEPSAEPEPSVEPEPSAKPEPSAEPEPSVEPEPSAEPEPSVEPEPSAKPEPSAEPEPSVEPEPSAKPEPSAEPEPSVEPEPSAKPEPSAEPEPSVEPEPSAKPEPSAEPEPSVEPEPSAKPELSAEPEPSVEPEPSAKPEPSAEPEPSVELEPSAKPELSAEPEPSVEPESSAEPESSTEHKPFMESKPSAVPVASGKPTSSEEPESSAEPEPLPESKSSMDEHSIVQTLSDGFKSSPEPEPSAEPGLSDESKLSYEHNRTNLEEGAEPPALGTTEQQTIELATDTKSEVYSASVTKSPESIGNEGFPREPNTTVRSIISEESSTEIESSTSPVHVGTGREFPADITSHQDVPFAVEHSINMQDTLEFKNVTHEISSNKSMTTEKLSDEEISESPDTTKMPNTSVESSSMTSSIENEATGIPIIVEEESTTSMMLEDSTLPISEISISEESNSNAPLPVIPLTDDLESTMAGNHPITEAQTESKITSMGAATTNPNNNDDTTTMSPAEEGKQGTMDNKNSKPDVLQVEVKSIPAMNVSSDESGPMNSSSQSSVVSNAISSNFEEESTAMSDMTTLLSQDSSDPTTESSSTVDLNNTEMPMVSDQTEEDSKLHDEPISAENEPSVVRSDSTQNENNETNIIERMPTTVFPKLPKNFAHNVEPLIEPLQNDTREEHIMVIPQFEHTTEVVHDPHGIIPQLIPEQSIPSSNESSSSISKSKESTKEDKIQTSTDSSFNRSTNRAEENAVFSGDSLRYEENLEHSTDHPLHPVVFPENAVQQVSEKIDGNYDKHAEDMSPFLPDVQKEKEVKKASPRLDKDEQDVPNPFEAHVEDAVIDKSLTEGTSTEQSVSDPVFKDSANDIRPELHDETKNREIAQELGRGFKNDANETENGIQNILNTSDVVSDESMKKDESSVKENEEEDEEALRVVPLEEQFKGTETTVIFGGDEKSNPTVESKIIRSTEETTFEKNSTNVSDKTEENAVEDQYNDIIDDTIPKGYKDTDPQIRNKFKDESNKLIISNLNSVQDDNERTIKSTELPHPTTDKINNTEITITSATEKHFEEAKLTTEIPVLPLEIQQEMSTTEKIESTTVGEESLRKENEMEHRNINISVNMEEITTQHISSMETKTTAQIPILPEELQTTENDSLTTSTLKTDIEVKSNDSQIIEQKDSAKTIIDSILNNKEINKTNDLETSAVQQVNVRKETGDDVITHAGGRAESYAMSNETDLAAENVAISASTESEPTTIASGTENSTYDISAFLTSSGEVMTTAESRKQISDISNVTEDVRPVTEILEDDAQPVTFDYKSHFVITTPKIMLPDLDVGELSEEDLKVIPLEKTLEIKKKSSDKKATDKFKYKKEKELNFEENDSENVPTEIPELPVVPLTELPHTDLNNDENKTEENIQNDDTVIKEEENFAPVPGFKTVEILNNANRTVQNPTGSDTTKKYPNFIPVSEEIIEPVTEPFVVRHYNLQSSNVDPATENPLNHETMETDEKSDSDNMRLNETSVFPTAQSIDSTAVPETDMNRVATEKNVVTTVQPFTQTKSPDVTVETTSHIDVSFLNLPSSVIFSKCTTGQFQCANGTSRDGAYCVQLSAKCDSVDDCSDGSDELNCERDGCPGNFQCTSGQCLKRNLVCNKIVDCDDGSDERNCEEWKCQFDEFRCPSGRCIPGIWQCDGRPDCEDHQDEYNCAVSCGNDEYLCPIEKWCIPLTWHCNGISECANGEDEKLCDCALDQFKCQTGGCIPENQVCDGIENCPDHSDEWDCLITDMTMEGIIHDGQKDQENVNGAETADESSLLKIRQYNGEYRLVCSDGWSEEFSNSYCQDLGFVGSESTTLETWDKNHKILRLISNPNHRLSLITNLEQAEFCVSDKVVQVVCQEFSCGSHYGEGPTARLVGGTPASEGQWSSVALLREPKHGVACTASILGPRHVLASYSCVYRFKESNGWQLYTGENLLKAYPVKNIIPYPQVKYNQFLYNNDIVLVELESPLTFSRNVSAVCLPNSTIQPRQICVTAGWGFSGNGDVDLQKYLNFLPLPTFDSEKCNSTSHYAGFITKDSICAGFTDKDKGPCYNDEGAPLMCVSESVGGAARWEIQGLLSHHSRCSRGHPAIYSSVEPALSWLRHSVPALRTQS